MARDPQGCALEHRAFLDGDETTDRALSGFQQRRGTEIQRLDLLPGRQVRRGDARGEVLQPPELVEEHLPEDPVVIEDLRLGVDEVNATQPGLAAPRRDGDLDGLRRTNPPPLVEPLKRLGEDPA